MPLSDRELQTLRNMANECEAAADEIVELRAIIAELSKLRGALLSCARQAEALKRECGMDPESAQALRNAQYQAISTTAHIALGTILGPESPPLPEAPDTVRVPRRGRKIGGTFEADGKIIAEFTTDAGVQMVVFQFDALPMFHIYRADQIKDTP